MKKYKCTYLAGRDTEELEGIFKVVGETRMYLTLQMVSVGPKAKYPRIKTRRLPQEFGGAKYNSFCQLAGYWGKAIQVYHDKPGVLFIYEPTK